MMRSCLLFGTLCVLLGPDVLRLEGRLLANEFALVPGFALLVGFHFRLLGC